MRVTGGNFRSRKIESPIGGLVEPVPDRVREAVFSILQHAVPGARVLDLFACSGSLGIEALSRGAESVLFVEKNPVSAKTIRRNLDTLGIADRAEVLTADALAVLPRLEARRAQFELAFLDPPYALSEDPGTSNHLEELVAALFGQNFLVQDAIAVFRRRKGTGAPLTSHPGLGTDTRTYGSTQVIFIERST